MQMKKLLCSIAACCMVAGSLSGCTGTGKQADVKAEGLENLGSVQAVSREEGSGTRSVFTESLEIYDRSTGQDFTREDSQIAESTEEVLNLVAAEPSAIGYLSTGAITDENSVHALNVEDADLSRTFYLTYSGTLTELKQDFLTYVRGAGQEIVGKNFQKIKKSTEFLSNRAEGRLVIGGSSSVAGLMEELAEAYGKYNPNAEISVIVTDSSDGLTKSMSGEYDFGMSSRELKDYEKELLTCVPIAKDEITVIVNCEDRLQEISSSDLFKIYTGQIHFWSELYTEDEEETKQ